MYNCTSEEATLVRPVSTQGVDSEILSLWQQTVDDSIDSIRPCARLESSLTTFSIFDYFLLSFVGAFDQFLLVSYLAFHQLLPNFVDSTVSSPLYKVSELFIF